MFVLASLVEFPLVALTDLRHGDVLSHQARDLVRLLRLDAYDTLLHQIAHLHVQEEGTILGAHLQEGERD